MAQQEASAASAATEAAGQGSAGLALAFSNVGHLLSHLLMLLYPTVVLALEGHFGLSYGGLLTLSVPGFIIYGVGALPAGWLGDRWSTEWMMVVYFIGSGLAALLTGFATGPLGIAAGLTLIGIFASIYHPVGVAWLVRHALNRGKLLAWNGIFGSIGVGAASLVAASLTDLWGWRAAFMVPGTICALLGVVLAVAVRARWVVAAKVDRRPQPEPARGDVRRAFIVLSITMLGAGLVGQAMLVALPKLFDQRLAGLTDGGTLGTGGFVTIVFLITGAVQMLGGWLADRFPLKPVYILFWSLTIPFFAISARLVDLPLVATVTLIYSCLVCTLPAENSLLVRYTPGKWRATAFGAKFVLSLGVSAAGVPLVAFIYDTTGDFAWLFYTLAALGAIVVAAAIFLPREATAAGAATPAPAE